MDRKLLRVPELAQILETSVPRAYELIRLGVVPGVVRMGRQIRIDGESLEAWIKAGGAALRDKE